MKDFEVFFDKNFMWKKNGFISIFDHWLTDFETDNCTVLNYEISIENKSKKSYLLGENSFINFYKDLSDNVVCRIGSDLKIFKTKSNDFEKILISSLREENLRFLDIFYPELKIRFKGGFDRTDQFFLTDESKFSLIQEKIRKNNLFVLDYKDFLIDNLD